MSGTLNDTASCLLDLFATWWCPRHLAQALAFPQIQTCCLDTACHFICTFHFTRPSPFQFPHDVWAVPYLWSAFHYVFEATLIQDTSIEAMEAEKQPKGLESNSTRGRPDMSETNDTRSQQGCRLLQGRNPDNGEGEVHISVGPGLLQLRNHLRRFFPPHFHCHFHCICGKHFCWVARQHLPRRRLVRYVSCKPDVECKCHRPRSRSLSRGCWTTWSSSRCLHHRPQLNSSQKNLNSSGDTDSQPESEASPTKKARTEPVWKYS